MHWPGSDTVPAAGVTAELVKTDLEHHQEQDHRQRTALEESLFITDLASGPFFCRDLYRQVVVVAIAIILVAIQNTIILEHMPIVAEARSLRQLTVFHIPFGRTSTVRNGIFSRAPRLCNEFLDRNRDDDVWTDGTVQFRKRVFKCVHAAIV